MVKAVDVSPKHKNSYVQISLSTAILVKEEEEDSKELNPLPSGPVDSLKSLSVHLSPHKNAR